MKFRKKPVVIDAIQWLGWNVKEVIEFMDYKDDFSVSYLPPGSTYDNRSIFLKTLEGTMEAKVCDWIIKGIKGEFYPCKPDIFEQTYELVN